MKWGQVFFLCPWLERTITYIFYLFYVLHYNVSFCLLILCVLFYFICFILLTQIVSGNSGNEWYTAVHVP